MTTQIKFRGFRTDGGGWVEGLPRYCEPDKSWGIEWWEDGAIHVEEIHPESLGQFTGQTDKNGKEIYGAIGDKGGDVIRCDGEVGYVLYLQQSCGFVIVYPNRDTQLGDRYTKGIWTEIIGNQFEQDNGK